MWYNIELAHLSSNASITKQMQIYSVKLNMVSHDFTPAMQFVFWEVKSEVERTIK